MTASPVVGDPHLAVGHRLPAAVAVALAAEMPDAVVRRWPGGTVWLPCGHPSAAAGANRFGATSGSRPDLPYELEVGLPIGTLVAQGTFEPVGGPGEVPVPQRCVLRLPDRAGADAPTGCGDHDIVRSGMEALAGLVEFDRRRPGRLAVVSTALDRAVLATMSTALELAGSGRLSPDQRGREARSWRQLVLSRWPLGAPEVQAILALLNLLAAPAPAPAAASPAAVELELPFLDEPPLDDGHGLRALLTRLPLDPGLRPQLWHELNRSGVHLAVPAYRIDPGCGAELSFLGATVNGVRHVFGFTSARRLAVLLDRAGAPMATIEATGQELTRFWPADHWLVLDPGGPLAVVLEPSEVRCLPHGPHHGVPHPDGVQVAAPGPDGARDERLRSAAAGIDAVRSVRLAVLVDKASGATRLVAAVALFDGVPAARPLAVFTERAAEAGVGGLTVFEDTDSNPLSGPLRRHARVVYRRPLGAGSRP